MAHRIAIIELRCINHGFPGLCKVSDPKKNKVTVFTTEELFKYFKDEILDLIEDIEWIFQKDEETCVNFLSRIEKICNDGIDIAILSTLRRWELIYFAPNCKVVGRISNLNFWFKEPIGDPNDLHIENAYLRKVILKKLDAIIVEYYPLKKYMKNNFDYDKKVYFVPLRVYSNDVKIVNTKTIKFVVPGAIQERRRNYNLILDVFEDLFKKYKNISLEFIGEPRDKYGKDIQKRCKELGIKCSNEYIYPHKLMEVLKDCDIIISPMREKYSSGTVNETYSVTKGTGVTSDVIECAKPLIVPETFLIDKEFESSWGFYEDKEDLTDLLECHIVGGKECLDGLQKKAIENSEKFSLKKMQEKFEKMLGEVLYH